MGHALGNNYGKFYSFQSKPVWLDLSFIVDSANGNGLGVRSVKGQGVKNVFMHTSSTPAGGNPNPAVGYALIELAYNYTRSYGGPYNLISPVTGSNLAINGSALTPGVAYVITSVGHAAAGTATIAPVADVSGSLASKWFRLYDAYGNTFIIWFSVAGVGTAPIGVGGTLVQQSIASGATAAQVGTALATTIAALPSGISGVFSFTATGTTTVTVVNTGTKPYQLPGAPADGNGTGFTFALTVNDINHNDWYAVGVPKFVEPAVGVSFTAIAAGSGQSTGTVKAVGVSGITSIETIGDPNQSIAPGPRGGSSITGGWLLIQFLGATNASTTTLIPKAPADETVVSLDILLEQAARVGGNQE